MLAPIVGAHYRPPAKAILAALPGGTPMLLRPEPSNPYDSNAIMVLLDPRHIPEDCKEELAARCEGYGTDLSDVLAQNHIHVGYIPATNALSIRLPGDTPATLAFTMKGAPAVTFEEP